MKTYKLKTRTHSTSYQNGLMGETAYQNDADTQVYPSDEMLDDMEKMAGDITKSFLNHPFEDRYKQFVSPSFTDQEPITGKKYMRRGQTFKRHYREEERENSSWQYRKLLNNPDYTCGKTWTVQEMVLYMLQPVIARNNHMIEPYHQAGIKRINRLITHLKKWRPDDFDHLQQIKIVDYEEEVLV